MAKKFTWIILSCLMALSLILTSCGTATPEEEVEEEEEVVIPEEEEEEIEEEEEEVIAEGPQYGGTLNFCSVAVYGTIKSPNPVQTGGSIQSFNCYAYEKLGVSDWAKGPAGTGESSFTNALYLYPQKGALAESWEQTDPYTITFHIREGVYFHDRPPVNGRELTAYDVEYSFNYELSNPGLNLQIKPEKIDSVTALDKYTVEVKANTIDTRIPLHLMIGPSMWIMPPEVEEYYGEGWADINGVCGTGPFILTDFVAGSTATFAKNPEYWDYDELNPENRLPYVDSVKWIQIVDKSTYMSALRTGKIDYLTYVGINDSISLKDTSPELEWTSYLVGGGPSVRMRADLEPYSDVRVRRALSMAIDREAIIEEQYQGMGEILTYPIAPDSKDVYIPIEELPEDIAEQFEYNPEKAKQYLADAGFPDGLQTECIVKAVDVEPLQVIVAYWKEIGVDCEIQVVDAGTMVNLTWGRKYEHMCSSGVSLTCPLDTLEDRTSDAMFNYEMHIDPEYDAGVAEAAQITDEAERNEKIKELTLMYLETVPFIQYPKEYYHSFWWPWLKNYQGEVSLGAHQSGALNARVWIDQDLKKEMGY